MQGRSRLCRPCAIGSRSPARRRAPSTPVCQASSVWTRVYRPVDRPAAPSPTVPGYVLVHSQRTPLIDEMHAIERAQRHAWRQQPDGQAEACRQAATVVAAAVTDLSTMGSSTFSSELAAEFDAACAADEAYAARERLRVLRRRQDSCRRADDVRWAAVDMRHRRALCAEGRCAAHAADSRVPRLGNGGSPRPRQDCGTDAVPLLLARHDDSRGRVRDDL